MRPDIWPDPRTVRTFIFAAGAYLSIFTSPVAYGQTPDVLPDGFYDELGVRNAALARSTLQKTLETHRSRDTVEWRNVATGTSGTVTPLRTYRIVSGAFCREFRETLVVAGSTVERIGTACRRSDDVWIRVEQ